MMIMSATLNFALFAAAAFCTTLSCLAVAPTFRYAITCDCNLAASLNDIFGILYHLFENLKELVKSSKSPALKQVLNTPVLLQNRL